MSKPERLARIDAAVAEHRSLYLGAVWIGDTAEAKRHSDEVDRLLELRVRVVCGGLTISETKVTT